MTHNLDQDAALMRATGIVRAFAANESDHISAVVNAAEAEHSMSVTFAAVVGIGALLAGELAIERGLTVEEVLNDILKLAVNTLPLT